MLSDSPKSTSRQDAQETAKNASTNLQGTWNFPYYEAKGATQESGTRQFVIDGNRLNFRVGGETRVETEVEVDSVQKHFTHPSEFAGGTERRGEFFIVLKTE